MWEEESVKIRSKAARCATIATLYVLAASGCQSTGSTQASAPAEPPAVAGATWLIGWSSEAARIFRPSRAEVRPVLRGGVAPAASRARARGHARKQP